MPEQIGKHSRKLARLRKAIQTGSLTSDGLLVIEGPELLYEANRSGLEIVDVYARPGALMPAVLPSALHQVTPSIFKTLQDTEHSQGVIATVRPAVFTLADVLKGSPALAVILARLQDPGNAGTILRVAEAFDATGCVALRGTVSLYNSKVIRASAGSLFRLPHISGLPSDEIFGALRLKRIAIVGTSPTGATSIETWDWRRPTAVMIGNEGSGLSEEELGMCEAVLRIPHNPGVESLNSAISTAVLFYEAYKQRTQ